MPDLVVLRERPAVLFLQSAPLVAEVASPGDESYRKFGFYFACHVDEVLIVDPKQRSVQWWWVRGAEAFERGAASAFWS